MTGGIQEIDMSRAMNSQSYAHMIWLNFYKYDNTCGANAGQIGQIEQRWNYMINAWYASYETDSNEYEVTEADYNQWVSDGEEYAHELSGYDNTVWDRTAQYGSVALNGAWALGAEYGANKLLEGTVTNVVTNAVSKEIATQMGTTVLQDGVKEGIEVAAGNIATTTVENMSKSSAGEVLGNACSKIVGDTGKQGTQEAAKEVTKESLEKAGVELTEKGTEQVGKTAADTAASCSVLIALACDAAGMALYLCTQPNKEEHRAVMDLGEGMSTKQAETTEAALNMVNADCAAAESVDTATTTNEEANASILDQSAEYKIYEEAYGYMLKDKTRGVEFDKAAVKQMDEYVACMTELSEGVDDTVAEAEMTVQDLHDEVESSISTYDEGAEAYAATFGYTETTKAIDTSTKLACNIQGACSTLAAGEAGIHAIKAFSVATSGAWAFGATAWAYVCAAAELGIAAADGAFASEQFKMAGEIKQEEGVRAQTEQMNLLTAEQYDTSIEQYQVNLEDMEALCLEVPDGIEAPESGEAAAGGAGAAMATGPTGGGGALTGGGNGEDEGEEPFDPYSFLIG